MSISDIRRFLRSKDSDDKAQGVVPASADLSGLLEPAPAQTGSLLKLRRCPTRMSRQYHPPLRGLQFRLTFVDPYEDIENCMGIRRGGAFGSPLANNLPLMPRRNLTPEGGSSALALALARGALLAPAAQLCCSSWNTTCSFEGPPLRGLQSGLGLAVHQRQAGLAVWPWPWPWSWPWPRLRLRRGAF